MGRTVLPCVESCEVQLTQMLANAKRRHHLGLLNHLNNNAVLLTTLSLTSADQATATLCSVADNSTSTLAGDVYYPTSTPAGALSYTTIRLIAPS
eukprot:scaffold6090_cov79-Cyclotella_meneghiniana.AAC.1